MAAPTGNKPIPSKYLGNRIIRIPTPTIGRALYGWYQFPQSFGGVTWISGGNDFPAGFQDLGTLAGFFATLNWPVSFVTYQMPWVAKSVGVLVASGNPGLGQGLLYFNPTTVAQAYWSFRQMGQSMPTMVIHPIIGGVEANLLGLTYIAVAVWLARDPITPVSYACSFDFDWTLANGTGNGVIQPL